MNKSESIKELAGSHPQLAFAVLGAVIILVIYRLLAGKRA